MYQQKKDKCLRCNGDMNSIGIEKLQLGQYGLLTGHLGNLFAGGIEVEIYICAKCKKIEFYSVSDYQNDSLPQTVCPRCGIKHDFDYPKCPGCDYEY